MTEFNVDDFISLSSEVDSMARTPIPGKGPNEQFLRGPIPLHWLTVACSLPGKSLQVSLAIWFKASLTKNGTVLLGNSLLARFGVQPDAKRRALKALEKAGLIKVVRRDNKNPQVTLLPCVITPLEGEGDQR